MGNLFTAMRNAPKRTSAIFAMIAAATIVPAALLAWGPNRPTYTIEQPADHVTFNSITNNPNIGDERNFVGIREAGTQNLWSDNMTVQDGKEYTVRMYVHNNAASSLNASGEGIAKNVTAKFNLPTTTAKSIQVNGFVNSTNASPVEVYDHAVFSSDRNFNLAYVAGSLKFENNAGTFNLPESIFTSTGAKLGYTSMNGSIPGCFQYAGYVTFKVKPQIQKLTNFTLQKMVSKHGANTWVENYAAQPGEVVDFVLQYKNTGDVQQDSVTFRDTLPAGLSYVPNSTKWGNARGTNTVTTNDGNLTNGTGINVGSYLPGAAAWTIFSAKVGDNNNLPACGPNTLKNTGKVTTGGYSVSDTATVTVTKECAPTPVYTCDALTVTKINRTNFKFATDYTVTNATFKHVTYVVRNAAGSEISRSTNDTYTQTTVGTYTVQAYVTVTVDGVEKTVTSDNCKKPFEVVAEKTPGVSIVKKVNDQEHDEVAVNEEFTYQLVVKNTGEVDLTNVVVSDQAPAHVQFISADKGTITDNKWSFTIPELKVGESMSFAIKAKVTEQVDGNIKNTACVDAPQVPGTPDDCDDATVEVPEVPTIKVCELATDTVITIKEDEFDSSKHSKNLEDCKKVQVCNPDTGEIITVPSEDADNYLPADSDKCKETPVTPVTPETPKELPTTGPAETLLSVIGLGSMIASVGYYLSSRRALIGR